MTIDPSADETNEQSVQPERAATQIVADAKAELKELYDRERAKLNDASDDYLEAMSQMRIDMSNELKGMMESGIGGAMRSYRNEGCLLHSRGDLNQIISPEQLRQARQEAKPGELPMMVVAKKPTAYERNPKAPVLAIVDLTKALGLSED